MTECEKCGDESMSFTCKYCGKKYCSKHRLPENHDCDQMEQKVREEREETGKWFQEKEVKEDLKPSSPPEPSLAKDIVHTVKNNATISIIAATVLVFIIQLALGRGPTSSGFYDLLVLKPGIDNVLSQPWTIVTVMFLHAGFFHVFANMVTLFFFGPPVERVTGVKEFLLFYFGAGIAASIGYIAFRNLLLAVHGPVLNGIPVLGPAVGASGAVVGVFAAVAMLYPHAEVLLYFFIPMRIKTALYLFGGIEGVNLAMKAVGITLPLIGNFASSAHLTGLLIGVWYGKKIQDRASKTSMLELI